MREFTIIFENVTHGYTGEAHVTAEDELHAWNKFIFRERDLAIRCGGVPNQLRQIEIAPSTAL